MSMVVLRPDSASRRAGSVATSTALSWLMVWVRALTAEALASLNTPQHLHGPVTGLRVASGPAAEHCPGSGFGVEGVGLAPPTASGLIGLVDLDHLNPGRAQGPGQRRTVGASALHSGPPQYPERAYPRQQRLVTGCGSGERLGFSQHAQRREHRGHVHVLVSITPTTTSSGSLLIWLGTDDCGMLSTVVCLLIANGMDG